MSAILDYIISSSVSLTVAGTTGISPFLTLLLLGLIEKSDPTLLNMNGTIEMILASWMSIVVLGLLTVGDFAGKCVPFIDEFIDSVEVFIVPALSVLGSIGTLGLLDLVAKGGDGDVDAVAIVTGIATAAATTASTEGLEEIAFDVDDGSNTIKPELLTVLKGLLILLGVFLSLSIHIFKMTIRIIGLTCSGGCCSPCFTIMEVTITAVGVMLAVFIQPVAIIMLILLLFAAGFAINRKYVQKKDDNLDNNGDSKIKKMDQNQHIEEKIDIEARGIEMGGHHQSQSLHQEAKTTTNDPPLAVAIPF